MKFLDRLLADATPAPGAETATAGAYELLGEPMPAAGDGFDLGPTVDDTNLSDAGGYPGHTIPGPSETDGQWLAGTLDTKPAGAPCGCKPGRKEWRSIRYAFTPADPNPVAASPTGLGGIEVISATLVASAAGIRVGPSSNDARAGAELPIGVPLIINAGPIWLAGNGATGTVDVFLEMSIR